MANRAKLGAGKQLQQLGHPLLYEPEPEIGGGTGSFEEMRNRLLPSVDERLEPIRKVRNSPGQTGMSTAVLRALERVQ
jgi:hypothetical protein